MIKDNLTENELLDKISQYVNKQPAMRNAWLELQRKWIEPQTLEELSSVHGSDKGELGYTWYYDCLFRGLRNLPITLLEIGIGGHNLPNQGGASLLMWRDYFHQGSINGIDIIDKSFLQQDRLNTFCGSQIDIEFLDKVLSTCGSLDIVIDDGSHFVDHQMTSFTHIFPKVKAGGFYIIEDTHNSYKKAFGGDPFLTSKDTTVSYFRDNIHYVNSRMISNEVLCKDCLENSIEAVLFAHGLIIIRKSDGCKEVDRPLIERAFLEWDEYKRIYHKQEEGYFDLTKNDAS